MELVIGIVLAALVGEQAIASAPAIARWIVCRAVLRLPEEMRARYSEEWLRVVEDVPGPLWKLWSAVGFLISTGALVRHRAGKELVAEQGRPHKSRGTPNRIFIAAHHGSDKDRWIKSHYRNRYWISYRTKAEKWALLEIAPNGELLRARFDESKENLLALARAQLRTGHSWRRAGHRLATSLLVAVAGYLCGRALF